MSEVETEKWEGRVVLRLHEGGLQSQWLLQLAFSERTEMLRNTKTCREIGNVFQQATPETHPPEECKIKFPILQTNTP